MKHSIGNPIQGDLILDLSKMEIEYLEKLEKLIMYNHPLNSSDRDELARILRKTSDATRIIAKLDGQWRDNRPYALTNKERLEVAEEIRQKREEIWLSIQQTISSGKSRS